MRDLKGVLEREKAAIGALLTLKPPTRPMREEAAAADFYVPEQFPGQRFPRLQILTIADLFAGKKLEYPRWAAARDLQESPPPPQRPRPGRTATGTALGFFFLTVIKGAISGTGASPVPAQANDP